MTAIQLDPHHDAAWRHLGYVKHNHRWMSKERIAEEEHQAQAQKHADRHWTPLLKKWSAELGNRHRRDEAEANLAKVPSRSAGRFPALCISSPTGPPAAQMLAVRLLEKIDAPESSQRLAMIAVFGETAETQQAATAALKGAKPSRLRRVAGRPDPRTDDLRVSATTGRRVARSSVVDSPRFRLLRKYDTPSAFRLTSSFHGYVGYDPNGMPIVVSGHEMDRFGRSLTAADFHSLEHGKIVGEGFLQAAERRTAQMLAEAQIALAITRERLAADVREIEELNAQATAINGRVESVRAGEPRGPAKPQERRRGRVACLVLRSNRLPLCAAAEGRGGGERNADAGATDDPDCFAAGTPVVRHAFWTATDRIDPNGRPGTEPGRDDSAVSGSNPCFECITTRRMPR